MARLSPTSILVLLSLVVTPMQAFEMEDASAGRANPIRRVVTMLQGMQKKVASEGEKAKDLYDKFMCYCKTSSGDLQKSIADAEAKIPQLESDIKAANEELTLAKQSLKKAQVDRGSAKQAISEATAIREKEAAAFQAEKTELDANIGAIKKAVAALEAGMGGASFVQTDLAGALKKLVGGSQGDVLNDDDRESLLVFLSGKQETDSGYAPQSGAITGILKQMGDEMAKSLAEATAAEKKAISDYTAMMSAKKKEIEALTKAIEVKTEKIGDLGVKIVEMKNDSGDTATMLGEDKKFIQDLEKNCATKTDEYNADAKERGEELTALAETIKILNDDDALELFKKTLPAPSASFLQVQVSTAEMRKQALLSLLEVRGSASRNDRVNVDFISLVLKGKKIGFDKVIKMIDAMITTLKKEQADDNDKKEYCKASFDQADDSKKALEKSASDLEIALKNAEEAIDTTKGDIEALTAGIKKLDASVVEATEQRKEENAAYKDLIASDAAAKEILKFAKNRLNKFYNPKLYKPPAKKELSAEGRISENFGAAFEQAAPPPPPPTATYKKSSEEGTGVISMIDLLIKELDKEMTMAEAEEKDSQGDYETFLKNAQTKRKDDSDTLADKEAALAQLDEDLLRYKADKETNTRELYATLKYIQSLHNECDWLLEYFDVRKNARTGEIDALEKASAVLSGADYSFLQLRGSRLHRRA